MFSTWDRHLKLGGEGRCARWGRRRRGVSYMAAVDGALVFMSR